MPRRFQGFGALNRPSLFLSEEDAIPLPPGRGQAPIVVNLASLAWRYRPQSEPMSPAMVTMSSAQILAASEGRKAGRQDEPIGYRPPSSLQMKMASRTAYPQFLILVKPVDQAIEVAGFQTELDGAKEAPRIAGEP